ncbi:MAG TPA: ATP phosphoribosyltransferase regulatory subunit, partial [Candidatus Dormibacteraeota bacterium]|nr:ATP phosphoribosyltransferase regulatory subunit [Candidatus Dormibacteraeota bacterium]
RNRRSERALQELGRVHELLRAHGLGDAVSFDLGAIRDFDYYTGVIFEGYGPEVGRPLVLGGRYDRLLGRFGRPAPATGFMVHLDLVGEVLWREGWSPALTPLDAGVAWTPAGLEAALRLGASLRLFGMRAVVDTRSRGLEEARAWARALQARTLLHLDGGARVVVVPAEGSPLRLAPDEVVERLARAVEASS